MKLAFIGYGSMGRMLVEGFLRTGAVAARDIAVANRSPGKTAGLAAAYPGIRVAGDNRAAARGATTVFLCVKPLEVPGVVEEIRAELDAAGSHVVSIAACVTLGFLERLRPGRYSKAIPSLASQAGAGVSLICHGPDVLPAEAAFVESLFASLGALKRIREEDFEAGADLTSCAPGLFAAMFRQFVLAGLRHSGIAAPDAEEMVLRTLGGTARLLADGKLGFQDLINRVATPGGITEEGVQVLETGLPAVFDQVFAKTLGKHAAIKRKLEEGLAA